MKRVRRVNNVKGVAFAVSIACVALVWARPVTGRQSDVGQLVAAARAALGGEAALAAITSLTISGSFTRELGRNLPALSFDTTWVSPDKFLRVSRQSVDGPVRFDLTTREGFNGDLPIQSTEAPGAPFPIQIPVTAPPTTPEQIAAVRARQLSAMRRIYIETLVPLFVIPSTEAGATTLAAGGKVNLPEGPADAIDITRADGATWRLLIDEKTRLPVQLRWRTRPIVTYSTSTTTSTTVVTGRGGLYPNLPPPIPEPRPPVVLPPGDPTAGMPDAAWVLTIGDYRDTNGLRWPRRLRSSFDGQAWQDFRISRYRLNPNVNLKMFEVNR